MHPIRLDENVTVFVSNNKIANDIQNELDCLLVSASLLGYKISKKYGVYNGDFSLRFDFEDSKICYFSLLLAYDYRDKLVLTGLFDFCQNATSEQTFIEPINQASFVMEDYMKWIDRS